MKTNQIIKSSLALFFSAMAFTACSSNTNKETAATTIQTDSAKVESTVPVQFEDIKVAAVYEHYMHVKNALVEGNGPEAQAGASALQTALTDAGNEKGADIAGKITSISDVEAQRAELGFLSTEVESVIKSSKITSGVIYKQYCPMANGNKGAYWLSSESAIKNPYFGDKMIGCGETKEEIK